MPGADRNPVNMSRPQPIRPSAPPQQAMPSVPAPYSGGKASAAVPGQRPFPPQTSAPQPVSVTGGIPFGSLSLNTASAHADITGDASSLQSALDDLTRRSSFNDAISHMNNLDSQFTRLMELVESARQEGYVYQADLEKTIYQAKGQWDSQRPTLLSTVQQQSIVMQSRVPGLSPVVQQLNFCLSNPIAAKPLLQSAHTQVNSLLETVNQVERSLQNIYSPIETQLSAVETRLNNIHWAMDQLAGATFKLSGSEKLVMGVAARWDKEGKEDPEGVLYLTDQRLVFERKEKVATKKVLFITTASQLVQEVQINAPVNTIRSVKADNRGLFGHQDYVLVQLADPKFGEVALHINGQESKEWQSLIERTSSRQIDAERVSGTGMSMSELTGPLTMATVVALQNEVGQLQDDMMLKRSRQELAELENKMSSLERDLSGVRAKGYVIEKNLEADITILAAQWDRIKANAETTINTQSNLLSAQMQSIQGQTAQLVGMSGNLEAGRPLYMQLKSVMASARSQADAAYETAASQYRQYSQEVEALGAHLDWVDWMLSALASASFRLQATECGIAAVEAQWDRPGMEPENGILYLTDQRLLWEDRVGTYELKVNVPLQQVSDVRKETEAGKENEFLAFVFASGAPMQAARFILSLPVADDWIKMVHRALSGDYSQDRAVAVDTAELERVRNSPQQCPKCGAAFSAPVLRGQTEIHCEYCGNVVRI